jgi:hypothetical protein
MLASGVSIATFMSQLAPNQRAIERSAVIAEPAA